MTIILKVDMGAHVSMGHDQIYVSGILPLRLCGI